MLQKISLTFFKYFFSLNLNKSLVITNIYIYIFFMVFDMMLDKFVLRFKNNHTTTGVSYVGGQLNYLLARLIYKISIYTFKWSDGISISIHIVLSLYSYTTNKCRPMFIVAIFKSNGAIFLKFHVAFLGQEIRCYEFQVPFSKK